MPVSESRPPEAESQESDRSESSYGQILSATSLVGVSSILNVLIGVVRGKTMAVLLGPAGVGLGGLYNSITQLTESIAGMGVNSSGVRQIAEAAGSGNQLKIAKTAAVLRWTSLALGLAAGLCLVAFARPVSVGTFGNGDQAWAVRLLGASVLLRLSCAGQAALLQGLRRIGDLAKANVLGTLLGAIASIATVYWLRETGVVISLLATAGISLAVTWWQSRKAMIEPVSVSASEVRAEAGALLQLGSVLMVSSFTMMGTAYLIRARIQNTLGLEATGLYQAAWTLGCFYVNFILQSMGSDFYPRLTASIDDSQVSNRLVNEQARVSLLLAGAGIIGTLTFAPWVIRAFYAPGFDDAVPVLRWICLGAALQVVSWPMGFIIIAKGAKGMLIGSELVWAAVNLGLTWLGLRWFGLQGAGIGFMGSYVFHVAVVLFLSRWLTGFRWSSENRKEVAVYVTLLAGVLAGTFFLSPVWSLLVGTVVMIAYGYHSISTITRLVPADQLPGPARRLLGRGKRMYQTLLGGSAS